ncbi:MAG: maltose alpha-D-glucosyltransferase [Myxococcales bacterium]|nr:maltose alpha-D-glucosyltransferase [Myxococcales bacterium]
MVAGRPPSDDPLWYKDAIIYEVRVRSFFDGNNDGIGDFAGLTAKLDYLQDLGVNALWLLPFYPSPMRDDGYDIADYTGVHPDCGTLGDFRAFLRQAHRRGFRVITELVLNHTSNQHAWFQAARRAPPGSRERDFYVWSDDPRRYPEARVIFQDFERSNWSWDPVAKAYYWHRFYSHQPDLNYDNPAVRRAMLRVVDFWFGLGVDGMRLDAVPYLFEREGTNCENLAETHQFLRELRCHVDRRCQNRMLLAEANQWPEEAAAYLGAGECHMAFHFPLMPRLFMAVRMEDRLPITDIFAQTPSLPEEAQWALFLRNHDELTLEMVAEDERDYMYRAFARDQRMRVNLGIRRRLAPLLGNNRRTLELLNGLLFSLPGSPVLYYGDEIGMGDNVYLGDRDGVRTPMQWSADKNAGFSRANPQRLLLPIIIDPQYHYEAVNVEVQEQSLHSLLWWMRRLIALRKRYRALGRGTMEFLNPENPKILAFVRRYQREVLLVVCNLSRYVQYADLDLAAQAGALPRELWSRAPFPRIGNEPYRVMLGPHSFFWFSLESPGAVAEASGQLAFQPVSIEVRGAWHLFARGKQRAALEEALPSYLARCRWFGGKARHVRGVRMVEVLASANGDSNLAILLLRVEYQDGEGESYALPLAWLRGARADEVRARAPEAVLAELACREGKGTETGLLCDALADPESCRGLLELLLQGRSLRGAGEAMFVPDQALAALRGAEGAPLQPRLITAEQSNTSVAFGERFMLKFFRRLDDGLSPEVEMGRWLAGKGFSNAAPFAGHLEYRAGQSEPVALAVLRGFVPSQGDAWDYTREEIRRFFERVRSRRDLPLPSEKASWVEHVGKEPLRELSGLFGPYLHSARLLGRRVAELHLALGAPTDDPRFAPELYGTGYHRAIYQSMRNLLQHSFRMLREALPNLTDEVRATARAVLAGQERLLERLGAFLRQRVRACRIRCHGDLHLGQVLFTGKDFVLVDFEGEPRRTLEERRRKRSALKDVAGMLRSLHYAAFSSLREYVANEVMSERERLLLEPWTNAWLSWSAAAFLSEYLATAGAAPFVPGDRTELTLLLDVFLIEKAVYELGYELNNRPDWVYIPLRGILDILEHSPAPQAT